jgi:hypothetical protein
MKKTGFTMLFVICSLLLHGSGPAGLFPKIDGWEKSETDTYTSDNLWNIINGAADAFFSYNFLEMNRIEYKKSEDQYIVVEAYKHKDLNNAFGIFSQERNPDYKHQKIGAIGYMEGSVCNFTTGNYYVKIQSHANDQETLSTIEKIAGKMAKNIKPAAGLPDAISMFPEKDKKPNSEMYIANNFLGHAFLYHAFTAEYELDDEKMKMFIIQMEDEKCKELLQAYYDFSNNLSSETPTPGKIMLEDKYNGNIYMVWDGNIIRGVTDCDSESMAFQLLD